MPHFPQPYLLTLIQMKIAQPSRSFLLNTARPSGDLKAASNNKDYQKTCTVAKKFDEGWRFVPDALGCRVASGVV
jgi:hypothetical protein